MVSVTTNLELRMTDNKKYWRGIEEQSNPDLTKKLADNEFAAAPDTLDFIGDDNVGEAETSRRDFLKFMGFTTAAATLAACEAPIVESIPYVVKPDSLTPGLPSFYATSMFDGQDYASLLIKTREGRPILVQPNCEAAFNTCTNARIQSSVLNLYDGARLRGPKVDKEDASWPIAVTKAKAMLTEKSVLLTPTIISPSLKTAISNLNLRHVTYDVISQSKRLDFYQELLGKRALPTVSLVNAHLVVGVGADFLGDFDGQRFGADYANRRKPAPDMLRHIQIEAGMSISGANADLRVKARVSEYELVLGHIYNHIAKKVGNPTLKLAALRDDIKAQVTKSAQELLDAGKHALLVSGLNSYAGEKLAFAINQSIGSSCIDTSNLVYLNSSKDEEIESLVKDVASGKVDTLVTLDLNPAHEIKGLDLTKVNLVAISEREDETATQAKVILPLSHYLESWGDFIPKDGVYSVAQPTISPLFDSKSAIEILFALANKNASAKELLETSVKSLGLAKSWNSLLHDGFAETSGGSTPGFTDLALTDVSDVKLSKPLTELEFYTYSKTGMGIGKYANNPWAFELPDPITRLSWDNYLVMSAADALKLGVENWAVSNGAMNGTTVNLKVNGVELTDVAVWVQPGQTKGTIGMSLGFGRTMAGKVGNNIGWNALELLPSDQSYAAVESINATDNEHEFASVQLAHTMMGRKIVNEVNLPDYLNKPSSEWNERITFESFKGPLQPNEANLWDDHDHVTSHMWNLSIDLNACDGCGACIVACHLENNVPIVGKEEVRRHRDMHWLRIDRYYSSDMTQERAEEEGLGAIEKYAKMEVPSESPSVVFQPVMCQHCNHAPCETVCPVGATVHSREGLNHMAYNRCIGTRYCANNCPYKVRRFNWFNYQANDRFTDVNPSQDDYGRMVLNPDVTVRSRGVIEKCSMCIQSIQMGKLKAKKAGRPLKEGDIDIACLNSCGSDAIVFGDINNPENKINEKKEDPRMYYLLDEIGTQPSVFYQTKVRNRA